MGNLLSRYVPDTSEALSIASRINTIPDPPSKQSTFSYWFRNPPFPELVNAQSAVPPQAADIVIIGSGITGASIARTILHQDADSVPRRIVMLEAREVCSGATGRNGGHIKPDPHTEYVLLKEKYGRSAAEKISDFRLRALDLFVGLAEAEGYDAAECRRIETADLFYDTDEFKKTLEAVKIFKKDRPGVAPEMAVLHAAEARKPYRLVTSILSSLLDDFPKYFTLETHTPVTSISTTTKDPKHPYLVHTPRGSIKATHVIHATNGYTAHLVPGLTGKIFPARGQMSAQRPGRAFPERGTRSWCFRFTGGYDYITQRPSEGGEMLAGGGLFRLGGGGSDRKRDIGATDDSITHFLPSAHLEGSLATAFGKDNWGEDAPGGRLIDMWSGILGISVDGLPWVGWLDNKTTGRKIKTRSASWCGLTGADEQVHGRKIAPGEWIAAGYSGEGMVNAWLCGTACALMVLGQEHINAEASPGRPGGALNAWFPEQLHFSRKRLKAANAGAMVKMLS